MTYKEWQTKRLQSQGTWDNVNPETYAAEMVAAATEPLRSALAADVADAIASRVADQLATVRPVLDASDRVRLESICKLLCSQPVCWDMEVALLERLLGAL